METLQDAYGYDDEETGDETQTPEPTKIPTPPPQQQPESIPVKFPVSVELLKNSEPESMPEPEPEPEPELKPDTLGVETDHNPDLGSLTNPQLECKVEPLGSEELSTDSISEEDQNPPENLDKKSGIEEELGEQPPPKKQKSLSQMDPLGQDTPTIKTPVSGAGKKSSKKKSKNNNVWTKPTSRKGKKKAKNNNNNNNNHNAPNSEDVVSIAPMPRFPDKNDDSPDAKICLSKVYKAEKVELGEDRLSAGSCKGYRMVRATRGVSEGAWYFEIKVVNLGESGHTRLGWSTDKGDLQAPVGYDGNSFGYRDIDGSKIHKARRENYGGEGYKEGDVIGFYINLPDGNLYAPKPTHMVWYKGQKYVCAPDLKEDPPKIIPGSEITFFKNGVCQGVAFKDLYGGRYYPAASIYTLPNQPNCVVKFNFGPDFECYPTNFENRAVPSPMIEVPYLASDNRVENGVLLNDKRL